MSTDTREKTLVERFYGRPGPGVPSEKQLNYLLTLAGDRVAPSLGSDGEERLENIAAQLENRRPPPREVSQWIDFLLKQPREPRATDTPTVRVGPGVYEVGTEIFVVKLNKEKTRVYALRLVESPHRVNVDGEHVDFDFVYARGAIYGLKPEDQMTAERAKHYLVRYGRCLVCRRKLKAAASVERGIGPVCIKYFA